MQHDEDELILIVKRILSFVRSKTKEDLEASVLVHPCVE